MEVFYHKGKPILNIQDFCKKHNTRMIKYKAERTVWVCGRTQKETKFGEMPEIFFDNLRMDNGWYYIKLSEAPYEAEEEV